MDAAKLNSLEIIFKHKEYFDQKLIDTIEQLRKTNEKLENRIILKNTTVQSLKHKIVSYKKKILDLNSVNKTLTLKLKEKEEEIIDISQMIKDLQNELEELKQENLRNEKEIEELKRESRRISDLNNKLNIKIRKMEKSNSSNSNMPSSHDILTHTKKKKPVSARTSSGKTKGGQKGHEAHLSRLSENDNKVIIVKNVVKAPAGAAVVKDAYGKIEYYATQEIDLSVETKIKETRYYISQNGEELEDDIMKKYKINPVTYTPHFKSTMIYLNHRGTIPYKRLCKIINEISHGSINIQESTVVKWEKEFLKNSQDSQIKILKDIHEDKIVHVDETGIKINGEMNWFHVITSKNGTYCLVTKQRGDTENGPVKLLECFNHVLVHDHFKTYSTLNMCKHAECNAHIDRYLKSGIEFENSEACRKVLNIFHNALKRKEELEKEKIYKMPDEEIKQIRQELLLAITTELGEYKKAHLNIEKKYEAEYIKLFRRLNNNIDDHLLFIEDFDVPYTNNKAERGCRKVKTKKNVSGQFITKSGADAYASIISVIQTARDNGENALEAIEKIMK